jgi:hypothetical protein
VWRQAWKDEPVDYDLARLGSYEFEHLTQALCLAVLGARVSVFGNGPDGRREATAEGRVTWDAEGDAAMAWDGYTVVQAKFRLRPEGVGSNLTWLLGELGKELSRWTDPRYKRSKTRKPDNLLIVTNVPLSAAAGGGVDTANKEIARLVGEHSLNLRAWRLWHYDDLCALLGVHRSVRITYGGFLTTGDVLARMDGWLDEHHGDLGAALTAHAVRDMIAQQYVRLGQAGDPHDERLALGSVAIDVTATTLAQPANAGHEREAEQRTVEAAAHILERGEHVRDHGLAPGAGRHLLVVGGPGHGKSTLAQMVCQAYRVSLLRESGSLSPEAARLRDVLVDDFAAIGLRLPSHLRWPVRVDLSDYGDRLAGNADLSLLRYLADRITAGSPFDLKASDLAFWLRRWPWLLVLDGLDEVASPHIREWATTGISAFLVDAAAVDADVLVVVTTRPQGYAGELGAEDYERLDLLPLDADAAVAYAKRLTAARFHDDQDLRQRVQARLEEAAADPDSSRLMTTPLQVTIMALLLERRQRAPHDRYQLFDAYFDTIYSRETNKPTAIGRLLEEHRSDIEAIHETVALALQQQAETRAEQHDASMSATEVREHALRRLQHEGHGEEHAARLADRLVGAATHRLVLLVPYGVEEVGFEVRSLQEYMAARALTHGEGQAILDRMRSLVASAHWRNTWLFAAGRLFRERENLREPLISMLAQVDNEGLLPWLARAGAELATDLLADDLAVRSPQYRRLLADLAVDRLDGLPDSNWRVLGALLQRIADEDPLVRQKLDRQVTASLAAGGGTRAHVVLMLDVWTRSTGGLAARARQLQHTHDDPTLDENFGTLLLRQAARGRDPKFPQLKGAPRLPDYVKQYVPQLDGDDRQAMIRLLTSLRGSEVGRFRSEDAPPDASVAVVTQLRLPELAILQDALSRPAVADGFSELVDRIPTADWHVAMTLREVVRYWYARRPASVPI